MPSISFTVAYRLFAKGQETRLQSPVTLYSFLQKAFSRCAILFQLKKQILLEKKLKKLNNIDYFALKEQKLFLIIDQITSSFCIL